MSESFNDSWMQLNQARKEFLLEEIPQSPHNSYLPKNVISTLLELDFVRQDCSIPSNYLSTHFYITRVFHPMLRPDGGKIQNTHFIDFFKKALPPAVGNFSPIQFHLFTKAPGI